MLVYSISLYYGVLTPGWHTLRAFSRGQRDSLVLWMKYWVVYALLHGLGCLTDFLFEGIMHYKSLKLILSALLWFSSPDSSNCIYSVLAKLMSVIDCRWYIPPGRFSWSSKQGDNHEEQRGEPLLKGESLKRELDVLMTEIANNRDNLQVPLDSLVSLDHQALQRMIAYLDQHYPGQQPEEEQQRESSVDDY